MVTRPITSATIPMWNAWLYPAIPGAAGHRAAGQERRGDLRAERPADRAGDRVHPRGDPGVRAVRRFTGAPNASQTPHKIWRRGSADCPVNKKPPPERGNLMKLSIGLEPMTPSLPSGPGRFFGAGTVRVRAVKFLQSTTLCGIDMTRVHWV
jgi:hypothetical protein